MQWMPHHGINVFIQNLFTDNIGSQPGVRVCDEVYYANVCHPTRGVFAKTKPNFSNYGFRKRTLEYLTTLLWIVYPHLLTCGPGRGCFAQFRVAFDAKRRGWVVDRVFWSHEAYCTWRSDLCPEARLIVVPYCHCIPPCLGDKVRWLSGVLRSLPFVWTDSPVFLSSSPLGECRSGSLSRDHLSSLAHQKRWQQREPYFIKSSAT